MENSLLSLLDIDKSFSENKVLKKISFDVMSGEFITLLGPSGCGKTTILRIIAGLENPDNGRVILDGDDVTSWAPNKRGVNMVFQNYALFPHMSVAENVGYGLKVKGIKKPEIIKKVKKTLELVQLEGFESRKPSELSGGQKQRVAIARAIINEPKLLLLDEPLSALDLQLRRQMQIELKTLQKKLGITFIYITHDQEEALNMSDTIVVINEGNLIQIGTPAEVYDTPKTSFVATFVGNANLLKGYVTNIKDNIVYFEGSCGIGSFISKGNIFTEGMPVTIAIRGENAEIIKTRSMQESGLLGTVVEKSFSGGILHIKIRLKNGDDFICNRQGIHFSADIGDEVVIKWEAVNAAVVDVDEG